MRSVGCGRWCGVCAVALLIASPPGNTSHLWYKAPQFECISFFAFPYCVVICEVTGLGAPCAVCWSSATSAASLGPRVLAPARGSPAFCGRPFAGPRRWGVRLAVSRHRAYHLGRTRISYVIANNSLTAHVTSAISVRVYAHPSLWRPPRSPPLCAPPPISLARHRTPGYKGRRTPAPARWRRRTARALPRRPSRFSQVVAGCRVRICSRAVALCLLRSWLTVL